MGRTDKKILNIPKAKRLFFKLLTENPKFKSFLDESKSYEQFLIKLKKLAEDKLKKHPIAYDYYTGKVKGKEYFKKLKWSDYAAIRILDYIENDGREFEDYNVKTNIVKSEPFKIIYDSYKNQDFGISTYFMLDMINLLRQFDGKANRMIPSEEKLNEWMDKFASGLDNIIVNKRLENKNRIINIIVDLIDEGKFKSKNFNFEGLETKDEKIEKVKEWWNNYKFHLNFAIRSPEILNKMLGYSLSEEEMAVLLKAKEVGIPFFVNPYYLSLLDVDKSYNDSAIRDYVLYSKELVNEFGNIKAWEKEDIIEPGKPNAAGWLLPNEHNIHRRYPEVAILIPDTVGRACGGLCSSCQRMYGFQKGNLNFNLKKLKPKETWNEKLKKLMFYFENDSQLRDVLLTGGDALMNNDKSLKIILDEIYNMAKRKREANKKRPEGEKYAEIVRVRLGTRLPVYIPQRITEGLVEVLKDFKEKASKIGIKQFIIQTHFVSPLEVTPLVKEKIKMLINAGWIVVNQLVFTAAASRRGHTAKLRKVLTEIGVLPSYTFSVKGFKENRHNFAPNARAVQEQVEEKIFGKISEKYSNDLKNISKYSYNILDKIEEIKENEDIQFLSTDRSVLNMPGVGKSMAFRVIGITSKGRRILEFDHDSTRKHSPIINKMGKIPIVESKPIGEYLTQIAEMGENEDISDYSSIWGYSISENEKRVPLMDYPEYDFQVTDKMTNLKI